MEFFRRKNIRRRLHVVSFSGSFIIVAKSKRALRLFSGYSRARSTSRLRLPPPYLMHKSHNPSAPRRRWKPCPASKEMLQDIFDVCPYPKAHLCAIIGEAVGASTHIIQIWFQNRRSRTRTGRAIQVRDPSRGVQEAMQNMRSMFVPSSCTAPVTASYACTSNSELLAHLTTSRAGLGPHAAQKHARKMAILPARNVKESDAAFLIARQLSCNAISQQHACLGQYDSRSDSQEDVLNLLQHAVQVLVPSVNPLWGLRWPRL